jgi:hypothetical protein
MLGLLASSDSSLNKGISLTIYHLLFTIYQKE